MSEQARQQVVMRDFPGLDLNADPRDLEQGAAREQTNLICRTGGMLVRKGLQPVSFDQTIDASP